MPFPPYRSERMLGILAQDDEGWQRIGETGKDKKEEIKMDDELMAKWQCQGPSKCVIMCGYKVPHVCPFYSADNYCTGRHPTNDKDTNGTCKFVKLEELEKYI